MHEKSLVSKSKEMKVITCFDGQLIEYCKQLLRKNFSSVLTICFIYKVLRKRKATFLRGCLLPSQALQTELFLHASPGAPHRSKG